jgi:hypothetical protein
MWEEESKEDEKEEMVEEVVNERGEYEDLVQYTPPSTPPIQHQRETPGTPCLVIPSARTPNRSTPNRNTPRRVLFQEAEPPTTETPTPEPPTPEPITERQSARLKAPENQKYYGNEKDEMIREKYKKVGTLALHVYFDNDVEKFKQTYHLIEGLVAAMGEEKSTHEKTTPGSYKQAMNGPDAKEWKASMTREWYAHTINQTFTLVPKPNAAMNDRKHHILMRPVWRFRIKTQQHIIVNWKARLCVDGSIVDDELENTFAGTPLPNAINLTFATAAKHGVRVHSGDVPAAYVQAPVPDGDTIYYMMQPEGFIDPIHPTWVLRLNKCLYGIRVQDISGTSRSQSSSLRNWE